MSQAMLYGVGAMALIVLFALVRSGSRSATRAARETTQGVSLFGRVLVLGALIAVSQWLVIQFSHDTALISGVLGVPALLAASCVVRSLTVPTFGGRR